LPFIKHRDFANGFLFAEILSRYFPMDVAMHSFENVTSSERKRANWALLERLIKVQRYKVPFCCMQALQIADNIAAWSLPLACGAAARHPS
jgi:CH-like domain in sperm protein